MAAWRGSRRAVAVRRLLSGLELADVEGLGLVRRRGLAERVGVVYALSGAALVAGDRSGERGEGASRGRMGLPEVVGVAGRGRCVRCLLWVPVCAARDALVRALRLRC